MSLLLDLSLRGALLAILVIALNDAPLGIRTSNRRWWWLLLPVPFLLPVRIGVSWGSDMVLPAAAASIAGSGGGLLWVWLAGAAASLGLTAVRTVRAARQWASEETSSQGALRELLEDCMRELGIAIHVRLIVSPRITTPAILGWFRPRVLLPASLARSMSRTELRAVFLHELGHCRACDIPLNWLFSVVCAVHWFNPLAHLAFARWHRFKEEAADETALRLMGESSARLYGDALLRTLRQGHDDRIPFGAMGVGDSMQALKRRIQLISQYRSRQSRAVPAAGISMVLASIILIQPARSQRAPDSIPCAAGRFLHRHLYIPGVPN